MLKPSDRFFFFNDTATTEIYTLSLHDALPISAPGNSPRISGTEDPAIARAGRSQGDRKSTRLNSSHPSISYAVFCLKKKLLAPPSANSTTINFQLPHLSVS